MKKLVSAFAVLCAVSLAACGSKSDKEDSTTEATEGAGEEIIEIDPAAGVVEEGEVIEAVEVPVENAVNNAKDAVDAAKQQINNAANQTVNNAANAANAAVANAADKANQAVTNAAAALGK